jgi:hypothetical protein
MARTKKIAVLVVLAFLEIVFLSLVFASNLPRRRADIDAFWKYQNAPTEGNKQTWLKVRQETELEVRLRVFFGFCLATGNAFLIRWVAQRRTISVGFDSQSWRQ